MEIISTQDAWLIADDSAEAQEETTIDRDLKPTNSARRVKALVEQVTGKFDFPITSVTMAEPVHRPLLPSAAIHTAYSLPHHRPSPYQIHPPSHSHPSL